MRLYFKKFFSVLFFWLIMCIFYFLIGGLVQSVISVFTKNEIVILFLYMAVFVYFVTLFLNKSNRGNKAAKEEYLKTQTESGQIITESVFRSVLKNRYWRAETYAIITMMFVVFIFFCILFSDYGSFGALYSFILSLVYLALFMLFNTLFWKKIIKEWNEKLPKHINDSVPT